jgi:hypothetical protein
MKLGHILLIKEKKITQLIRVPRDFLFKTTYIIIDYTSSTIKSLQRVVGAVVLCGDFEDKSFN